MAVKEMRAGREVPAATGGLRTLAPIDKAPDEDVGLAHGEPEVPRDDIVREAAEDRGDHERGSDDRLRDEPFPDRPRDLPAKVEPEEIPDGGETHRLERGQDAGRDDRRDRVRCVRATVPKGKEQYQKQKQL